MATSEVIPLCAIAQIDNKFPAYSRKIGFIDGDVLEKLSTIATIWMLQCEVESKICPSRKCITQSPQSSPGILKESKKTFFCKRSNWELETSYSTSSDPLLFIESACDHEKNNKRFYSYNNVFTQLPLYFLSNRPLSLSLLAGRKKRGSPILEDSSLAVIVDLQSLDGQIIVAQKKKQKSNKNNQKGKRNGDKAGQNKKYEEKDGSDEEDDTNNDANRDSGKKEDDDGNKDNHGDDKKDEKEDEDKEDEIEKKVDENEEEKKEENEGKEKVEENDDKNKEQEYSEESFYITANSKKNKKTKSKKNGKNKAQPPEKTEVGLLNTIVSNEYHALNDLETSGKCPESLVLNANTMDGRDLDSSDNTFALDKKQENESLSSKVNGCEILKTTDSILLESRDDIDDGDTGSILDDSQANRFVENSSRKKSNASHTNELEGNTETVLSSIDLGNSDVDRKENPADCNSNQGFEDTEKDLGQSNSNAESFKVINKKGKKQKKKEPQKSQALLKNKISINDSASKLSLKCQDLDLIQMPGAFSLDFLGNGNVPLNDKLDEMQSDLGVAHIDPTVEKTYVEDNITTSQEVSQSNELATEISLITLNPSGDTETFLTQDLTSESFFDNKNRTNSVEMEKMSSQKSVISTEISQEKVSEPNNINSDLTNDTHKPSNDHDKNIENIALDKLIKSHSAIFTGQENSAIGVENIILRAGELNQDINSKDLTPNIQPEHVESRKDKDKALDKAEMKKFKARATQQAKVTRKEIIEAEDTIWGIEPNLKADEQVKLKNKEEIQTEFEAKEETESKSIKEIECEAKFEAKALKSSKSSVGKQMKKLEAEQTLNSKKGVKKILGKEKGKNLPLKDEDTIAAGASHDEERNIANDDPENIAGDSNINNLRQSTNLTASEESVTKLETNLNNTIELQFNNLDINLEVVTEARPGKDDSTMLNQDRSLEENSNVFDVTHDHDKPAVELSKDSKSKSRASKIEKKKKEGNVANKLKSFEALEKRMTPLSSSKVQDAKEPHFSPKDDDFMISELSPMESIGSKDVPGSSPQENVDVNVEKIGGKKSKIKKISKMKEDKRNLPMNEKIRHEDEQDLVDTIKVQHSYNEHEVCPKLGDLEELGDNRNLGKPGEPQEPEEPEMPEQLDESGEIKKPGELEELGENRDLEETGELQEPEEPEKLDESGEIKKPDELKELGENRELEMPGELQEPEESEMPVEPEEFGEPEELGELKEPGELGNLELGEFKGIGEPENSNDHLSDEKNFDETSALILSQAPKAAPFYSLNLQPEVKTIKKKRPRNIRDGSPWGMLGVGPRKDVKRIAKRKSGDVKKVLGTKHKTPIKNPEKNESVRVSPPKRAEKTIRPPISRGISSIFAAPIRSKSVAERRSGATRKPSSRRQSTSEAIGISSPFIGSGNKPEISLKAAKLLGVSPSPVIIPNKKAMTNPVEYEDTSFESMKEDFTSPEKQSQNRKTKDDSDDVIIESGGPSEPVMKRPESNRRTSIGGILGGLISSRSRPGIKRRSIATEEDSRSLRREDRKIKQSNRGISEVKMSGGLTDEAQKEQRLAQQAQEKVVNKYSDENLAAENIKNVRKSRRSDRKLAEEAAERKTAELSQKARRARRSEKKAAEEAFEKKMTEREAAETVQKARRARRAERKVAEEISERKAAEPAQKSRRAQRTERAELNTTEISPKKEVEKKEAAKKTNTHRRSSENTRRTSDEERRERHRRKEAEQDERQNEEREARQAARRSQRLKEKGEKRGVESRHSKKNHAGEEKSAIDDCRKDESYLEKANYRNSISQIPEFDEGLTFRNKERRSSRAIPRDIRPKYGDLGLPVEYQKTKKSLIVKEELDDRSNEQDETPWPDCMPDSRAKERLKDPLTTTSPLLPLFVKPKTSTEHIKHREARKSDSFKNDGMRYERHERDERRRKRDSRIQEDLAIPHGSHGNERRSSHRSSNFVESKTSGAQGSFLSRWKRLAGV